MKKEGIKNEKEKGKERRNRKRGMKNEKRREK